MVTRAVDPPDAARTHLGGNYISSRGDPERLPLSEERAIRALLVGDRDIGVREGLVDHGGTIHIEQHIFGYLGLPLSGLRGPASGQGLRGGRLGSDGSLRSEDGPGTGAGLGSAGLGSAGLGSGRLGSAGLGSASLEAAAWEPTPAPTPLAASAWVGFRVDARAPAGRSDGRSTKPLALMMPSLRSANPSLSPAWPARRDRAPRSNRFNHDPTSSPPNSRRSSPSSSSTSSTGPWTTATSSAPREAAMAKGGHGAASGSASLDPTRPSSSVGLEAVRQAEISSSASCPLPGIQTTAPGRRASHPSVPIPGTRRAEDMSMPLTAKPYRFDALTFTPFIEV